MSRASVIHAQGVHFAYPPIDPSIPAVPVLTDLSFEVAAGECLALMGANGAGKTTLCSLVTALAPQLTGGKLRGQLVVLGQDVAQSKPGALAGRVGITFQEVEHQLFNATVEAEVAWGLEALGLPPAEIEQRIQWALEVVGLDIARSRPPASLSGGQQRRLALAVAVAPRPELLVLDEPFSGLDPAGSREVWDALAALRQESAAAILMTESKPEVVLALADRVAILNHGRVALEGSPRAIFGVPKSGMSALREMGVAVPQLARLAAELNARDGTSLDFLTLGEAGAQLNCTPPTVDAARCGPIVGASRCAPTEPHEPREQSRGLETPAALYFEQITFNYPNGPPVLQEIELAIPAGRFVALLGANGSGKTTLAKQTIGLLRPVAGRVWVGGKEASQLSVGQLAHQVGYLFQHPERQIFASTVRDEVAFGPRNLGLELDVVEKRVTAALDRFKLTDLAASPPAVLSYALRRLVTLASVAAMEPAILVLDEPTVGLDAPGRETTLEWAHELHAAGGTVLLVTHDMAAAAQVEQIVVLDAGQVIANASPAEIFNRPELLARAALEPPPIAALAQELGLPAGVLDVDAFLKAYVVEPEIKETARRIYAERSLDKGSQDPLAPATDAGCLVDEKH